MTEMTRGPYMNEDGDWWVAVEDVPSFRAARAHVVAHLDYSIPDDGTLRYRGKHVAMLCENDFGHETGPDCDEACHRNVEAYHFEENRRW